MIKNIQNLELAIEKLNLSNLSNLAKEQIIKILNQEALSDTDIKFLAEELPMELLAQIQASITTASGESDQNIQSNRFQDAETFVVEDMELDGNQNNELIENAFVIQATEIDDFLELDVNLAQQDRQSNITIVAPSVTSVIQDNPDIFKFEYRTINAVGNNTIDIDLGTTHTAFMTVSGYQYGDNISQPNDVDRPNVRNISNEIFAQDDNVFNTDGVSNFLWVWGQFLDHDINLTAEGHTEYYNIDVPIGDAYFDPFFTGTNQISFTRSGYLEGSGEEESNPRLQVNEITAFIDASNIYGSDSEVANALRTDGGKLLMGDDDLLPLIMGNHGMEFYSGDVRTNENVGLTAMHTIFAREHNHWVDWVAEQRPEYSDDKLYEVAKSIVEAEMQAITYNEFLPLLLGEGSLSEYQGYNSSVNLQVSTEFATAAFRVGHTMLSSDIFRLQADGEESEYGHLTLQEAFFRPDIILSQGGIDETIRGLGASYSQNIDASIIDDVRNFLFGPPGAGGFDLVSLNIQRGRDHGIPDYNSVRESYGLEALESFNDLTSDAELAAKLTALYGTIDSLDLWVGGLIEAPHEDALIGETFYTIIADQFTRLRDGDRFWYENRFDEDFLDIVENTSLSDVILRNTDIDYLQDDIFTAYNRIGGNDDDNTLIGTNDSDLIIGFGGNDIINGGDGADTLYGGSGADVFIFDNLDGTVDTIRDFNTDEDKIDISLLIESAFDPLADVINDFLFTFQSDTDISINVDRDGAGDIFSFENVIVIENVTLDTNLDIITL